MRFLFVQFKNKLIYYYCTSFIISVLKYAALDKYVNFSFLTVIDLKIAVFVLNYSN